MTNKYPGTCAVCMGAVAVNEGTLQRDRLGFQVKHVVCPEKIAPARPTAFMMPNRQDEFVSLVGAMSEPGELNHVRKILNSIKAKGGKHPLYDVKYGFAQLYRILDARAKGLGLEQYNSDRMYFRPLGLVATNPI